MNGMDERQRQHNESLRNLGEQTELRARAALKFVRVSLTDGHLTDVSIEMLLIEFRQRGLRIVEAGL